MNDAFVQHGAFSWCELMTTDVAAAKRFYAELLGWSITETPVGDAPDHRGIGRAEGHPHFTRWGHPSPSPTASGHITVAIIMAHRERQHHLTQRCACERRVSSIQ
jgi:catechol 2,3-dioxygenase-like lactoylglutathione lyase family enzyme